MTTILAFVPFAWLPESISTAVIWGGINSLLFFAIIRTGKPWRLLVFASGPYAMSFLFHQPSPLIAAVMLLPSLLPLALIKPQTGLPVIMTHLTPLRLFWCVAFIALTFILYPRWPWVWWESARNYDGAIPLFLLPLGPLIALALFRVHRKSARALFLFACIPQRSIYDLVPLMLLPQSRTQSIVVVLLSWLPIIAIFLSGQMKENMNIAILSIYLPLVVLQWKMSPTLKW